MKLKSPKDGIRLQQQGGIRRIVILLVSLVTLPTAALLAVGILMLVLYQESFNLLFGVLVVSLVVCLLTGTILALFFLRREAQISQLQQDFVSKVSHELRTPLTSIQIFAETIRRRELPAHELDACHDAMALEVGRLSARIERLLDWGRMQAGKRSYALELVEPALLADEALIAFRSSLLGREASVDLELELDAELPLVRADRVAFVDALVNLLSNAYKYSPTEPKFIRLSVRRQGQVVRYAVRDRGIGIPHSEHRRIFQKFYRVDERLTHTQEGTGLGLALVGHIVAGHRGKLLVESEPGLGTTMSILLAAHSVTPAPQSEKDL